VRRQLSIDHCGCEEEGWTLILLDLGHMGLNLLGLRWALAGLVTGSQAQPTLVNLELVALWPRARLAANLTSRDFPWRSPDMDPKPPASN
jgi:hypothetical protein